MLVKSSVVEQRQEVFFMERTIYSAIFLDEKSIKKLESYMGRSFNVKNPHSTICFKPSPDKELPAKLIGKKITFEIEGIGLFLDQNVGFKVNVKSLPFEVLRLCQNLKNQHITFEVKNGGKPVNTQYCDWFKIGKIQVSGKLGNFTNNKINVLWPKRRS